MKRMINKFSILFFIALLIMNSAVMESSGKKDDSNDVENGLHIKKQLDYASEINESYGKGNLKNFAGIYLDDNGNLNVRIKGEKNDDSKKVNDTSSDIAISDAIYTLDELIIVQEKFIEQIENKKMDYIVGVGVDVINNKVSLDVTVLNEKVKKEVGSIADINMIEFVITEGYHSLTSPLTNGSAITNL